MVFEWDERKITDERIRIISARRANKREQYDYYKEYDFR